MRKSPVESVFQGMHVRVAFVSLLLAMLTAAPAVARNGAGRAAAATALAVSSPFGLRADPFQGSRAMHRGVDLPGPSGTPVLAAASGTVRFAGPRGGFGNMVEIEDADGTRTRYAHLSQILVRPGGVVAQGSVIALMGSTGRSTGSHLHFELWVGGRAVDPLPYIAGNAPGPAFSPRATALAPALPHRSAFAQARSTAQSLSDELPGGIAATTK